MQNKKDIILKSMNQPEIKWNVTKNIMYKKESLSFDDLPEEVIRIIKTIKRNIESTEYIPIIFKTIKLQNIKDYLIKTDRDTFYNSKVNTFRLNNLNQKNDYEHFFYKCINRLKSDNKFKYSKENKKLISIEDLIKYSYNEDFKNKKKDEKIIEDNHKWLKENNIDVNDKVLIHNNIHLGKEYPFYYSQVYIEKINKRSILFRTYISDLEDCKTSNVEIYDFEGKQYQIYKFCNHNQLGGDWARYTIPIEEFRARFEKPDFKFTLSDARLIYRYKFLVLEIVKTETSMMTTTKVKKITGERLEYIEDDYKQYLLNKFDDLENNEY